MRTEPTCPRCGGELKAPGLWSSAWTCARHGSVQPFRLLQQVGPEALDYLRTHAAVPVWLPWPLPQAWTITGFAYAGDERTGALATVVACSGPAPLGGGADALFIAEEPGVGLATRYAGQRGTDPGAGFDTGPPHAKLEAAGHPTALWALETADDCASFVGEAKGRWLWVVVWPGAAGVVLYDDLKLQDVHERRGELDLPYGGLCPRLAPPAPVD